MIRKTVRTCSQADKQTDRQTGRRPDGQVETRWWSQPVPPNDRVPQTENKEGEKKKNIATVIHKLLHPLTLSWPLSTLPSPLPSSLAFQLFLIFPPLVSWASFFSLLSRPYCFDLSLTYLTLSVLLYLSVRLFLSFPSHLSGLTEAASEA